MKKFFLVLFGAVVIATLLFVGYEIFLNKEDDGEDDSNIIKDIIKKEYIYYDELYALGYSKEDIDKIENKFKEEDVKKYLLNTKYDNLFNYSENDYFKISHIDRYNSFEEKSDYDTKDIVMYVEIGLDKEFYTEINEVDNYDNILVLVNKFNKLPKNYSATDLITLEGKYSSNNQKMKGDAAKSMKSMIDSAKADGLSMKVISGYRTESLQNTLFTNSTKRNGLAHALIYSARPGHSEHQTGYAADINSVQESFANTEQYTWLCENAYKYGFIERYPKGKEFITGYGYEPWHYRYVGVEVAAKIYTEKITFEEYAVKYLDYSS